MVVSPVGGFDEGTFPERRLPGIQMLIGSPLLHGGMNDVDTLIERLVAANRILSNEGILEGFGHVSALHPEGDRMLISRSISPGLVTTDDILTMTLDGEIVEGQDHDPYLETVIHRAIYRNRSDVAAIVHHHDPSIIPFASTDTAFKPVFHLAAIFHEGVPTFSDFDARFGRLVVTETEGDRMADVLGGKRAQLLENHGANVTGETIREAVISTVFMVKNAQYQLQAESLGDVHYYEGSEESIESLVNEVILAPVGIDRMWEFLLNRFPES